MSPIPILLFYCLYLSNKGGIAADNNSSLFGTGNTQKLNETARPTITKYQLLPTNTHRNCSCAQEIQTLRDQMKYEVSQRIDMQGTVELFVSEIFNLKSLVNSKFAHFPIESKTINTKTEFKEIAFSARVSRHLTDLKPHQIVVFGQQLTNVGGAYDPSTGTFHCSISGTYQFFATILSGFNTKVESALVVNDIEVARLYSGAQHAHGSSTAAVIILLERGDVVTVKVLYQESSHVHGVYSTFTGYLLRPL